MGLSVHFWIVFQSVIFGEKFQLNNHFCTTEFLLRILLLLFPLLVSLLGIGYYYYYWYEQFERSYFTVRVHTYLTNIVIKQHSYILICLLKSLFVV